MFDNISKLVKEPTPESKPETTPEPAKQPTTDDILSQYKKVMGFKNGTGAHVSGEHGEDKFVSFEEMTPKQKEEFVSTPENEVTTPKRVIESDEARKKIPEYDRMSDKGRKLFQKNFFKATGRPFEEIDVVDGRNNYGPGDKSFFIEDYVETMKSNPDFFNAVVSAMGAPGTQDMHKKFTDDEFENMANWLYNAKEKDLNRVNREYFEEAKKRIYN